MIVDPDFLDHWRTRMVVDALSGDELAPTYILRLWAHCQTRRSDRFTMPTAGLKAQCRFAGDARAFETALIDAGFVSREGAEIHVLGWAEQNAALLAAWENGNKGGRPRKPNQNPRVNEEEPKENPAVTQGKPNENPDETDKSREEKSYSEANASGGKPPKLSDPKEIIFGYGLTLLVNAQTPEKHARSFLGGRVKEYGEAEVVDKLRECVRAKPLQPLEWLAAALPPLGASAPPKVRHLSAADRRAQTIAGLTNPGADHAEHSDRTIDVAAKVVG